MVRVKIFVMSIHPDQLYDIDIIFKQPSCLLHKMVMLLNLLITTDNHNFISSTFGSVHTGQCCSLTTSVYNHRQNYECYKDFLQEKKQTHTIQETF